MKKRILSLTMALFVTVSMFPSAVFAAPMDSGAIVISDGLCEHHTQHDEGCGYTEGVSEQPCTHEHTEECYVPVTSCIHTHDESCGGLADPPACTHVCGEDTGCVTKTLNCQHQHDESCGYTPAIVGTPCGFVCEVCQGAIEQEQCSCSTLCTEGAVNPECPVCSADFSACQGKTPVEPVCTCATLCAEGSVNPNCPVCSAEGADLAATCKGEAPVEPTECICKTLCAEGSTNQDCLVCSAEGADLAATCKGVACSCTIPCTVGAMNEACPVCGAEGAGPSVCTALAAPPLMLSMAAIGQTVTVAGIDLTTANENPVVYALNNDSSITTDGAGTDNYNVMWDGETLTLKDFDLSLNNIRRTGDLTIQLNGDNTITSGSAGTAIEVNGSLTINGGGSLEARCSGHFDGSGLTAGAGISAAGNITIGSGTITAEGGGCDDDQNKISGIYAGGNITIATGADVTAQVNTVVGDDTGHRGHGVYAGGALIVSGSLKATGGSTDKHYSIGGSGVAAASITVNGGGTLHAKQGTSASGNSGHTVQASGAVIVEAGGQLTTAVTVGDDIFTADSVTVNLSDNAGQEMFNAYNCTVQSGFTVNGRTLASGTRNVYLGGTFTGDITVNGGNVEVGWLSPNKNAVVNGGRLAFKGENIGRVSINPPQDCSIQVKTGAYEGNATVKGTYINQQSWNSGEIDRYFEAVTLPVNLYVGGVGLGGNQSAPAYARTENGKVDTVGASESDWNIKWDGSTLTLKEADIRETAAVGNITAAVYFKGSTPLDITLEDTNAISVGSGYGIYTGGALNLLDGGELDVTGGTHGIHAEGEVEIAGSANVRVTDSEYGIYTGGALRVTGGKLDVTGGTHGLHAEGEVEIAGSADISVTNSKYGIYTEGVLRFTGTERTGFSAGGTEYGIYAKDSIAVNSPADITVTSSGIGIHTDGNLNISISDSRINVTASSTGVEAQKAKIQRGEVTVTAGSGASAFKTGETPSGTVSIEPSSGAAIYVETGTNASSAAVVKGSPFESSASIDASAAYFHSETWASSNIYIGGVGLSGAEDHIAFATTDAAGKVTTEGASEDNWNIRWDGETLTLRGATIKGNRLISRSGQYYDAAALYCEKALMIVLEGDSTIESVTEEKAYIDGIFVKDDIEISGIGKLTVTSAAVYDETMDLGSCGISGDGKLTVKNGATVIATGGDNSGYGISQGINVMDLTVEEGASVIATGGKADGNAGMSTGITVGHVTVYGTVNAAGGNAVMSSFGVQTEDAVITGTLEATGSPTEGNKEGPEISPESAGVSVSSGIFMTNNFTIDGGTVTATGGTAGGKAGLSAGIYIGGSDSIVMVNGGTVKSTGGADSAVSAGIYASVYDNNEGKEPNANVTTNSGTVEITGVNYGAKIGGTFTVAGGEVTVAATGSSGKAIETDSVKISPTAPQLISVKAGSSAETAVPVEGSSFSKETTLKKTDYNSSAYFKAWPVDPVTVTITGDGNVTYGDSATFTAQVSGGEDSTGKPTGTVQFYLDGTSDSNKVGVPQNITGAMQVTLEYSQLPAGDHTVYAVYSGDNNFAVVQAQTTVAVAPRELSWDTSGLTASRSETDTGKEAAVYGALGLTGILEKDTVNLAPNTGFVTSGLAEKTEPGEYTVTVVLESGSFTIDNANYALPGSNPSIIAVINPEEEVELPDGDGGNQYKLTVEDGISTVPDGLKGNPDLNTPEKIETRLKTVVEEKGSVAEGNIAIFDVTLMVSVDGGLTWTEATEQNFPADGLTITLPYPEETGQGSHNFTVVHMFTSNFNGNIPGDVETPAVTKTANGIQFTVNGLSPIAVGWKPIQSSSGGSGSSYRDREYDFWMEVKEKIQDADPGDTIKANARSYDRMPWSVMEALREADGVTLHISWYGGEDIIIPSAAAPGRDSARIYYPLSYLEGLDFTVVAEPEDSEKLNPETGGVLEITAPVADSTGIITAQPEITAPERGLAETPELADEGIEKVIPGIYESETEQVDSQESAGSTLPWIAAAAILLAGSTGAFWFWKRKTQE